MARSKSQIRFLENMALYDRLLKEIINSMEYSTGTINRKENQHYYDRIYPLMFRGMDECYNISEKLNDLKYSYSHPSNPYSGIEISGILERMVKNNKNSIYELYDELLVTLGHIQNYPLNEYEVYIPYNLKIPPISIPNIDGVLISICSHITPDPDDYERYHYDLLQINKYKEYNPITSKWTGFIKINIKARNENYANFTAQKYAKFLISILALSKFADQYHNTTKPSKDILEVRLTHSFIFEKGRYLKYYVAADSEIPFTKEITFKNSSMAFLSDFLSKYDKAHIDVKKLLINAMAHYFRGISESSLQDSFMYFWMIIELITIKKAGTNHYKIVNKLKGIFLKLGTEGHLQFKKIYDLRNSIVHNGDDSYLTQIDRSSVKIYAESAMLLLLEDLYLYSLQELEEIYGYIELNKSDLNSNYLQDPNNLKLKHIYRLKNRIPDDNRIKNLFKLLNNGIYLQDPNNLKLKNYIPDDNCIENLFKLLDLSLEIN